MSTASQIKASASHRRRTRARGLMRVEVQAAKSDTALIRAIAETLRGDPKRAKTLRAALERGLNGNDVKTAFDVFGSDIPDEAFAGIFDQPRQRAWRKVAL